MTPPLNPIILLIGYYGKDNAGDEWIKEKSIHLIKKIYPNALITDSKKTFLSAHVIVYGGGGLFQNKTSNRSLIYYCFWILLALLLRKPVYLLGQGVGPIAGRFWNKLTFFCLKKATAISVRDQESYDFLSCPGKKSNGILATDLAFYNSSFSQNTDLDQAEKHIILNLRPWPHAAKQWPELQTFLQSQASLFLSCSPEDTLLKDTLPQLNLLSLIRNQACFPDNIKNPIVVSMRFHACVWAALHGIPFLALIYDNKVKHLAEYLKQPSIHVDSPTLTLNEIQSALNELTHHYTHYQNHLKNTVPTLLKKAYDHEQVFHA